MNMSEARLSSFLPRRRASHKVRPARNRRRPRADPAIRHWLDAFHLLHTDGAPLIPVALRLEPTPDAAKNCDANRSPRQIATDRRVYEVARRQVAQGEAWVLVMWKVDVPGVMFCDCADRAEALALFAEPAKAAGRWQGARLRPEARPW
jgi:hypothetical protein